MPFKRLNDILPLIIEFLKANKDASYINVGKQFQDGCYATSLMAQISSKHQGHIVPCFLKCIRHKFNKNYFQVHIKRGFLSRLTWKKKSCENTRKDTMPFNSATSMPIVKENFGFTFYLNRIKRKI